MRQLFLATAAIAALGFVGAAPVLAEGNSASPKCHQGNQTGMMGQMQPGSMMGGGMGQMQPGSMMGSGMGQMMGMMDKMQGRQPGMMRAGGRMMGPRDHMQAIFDADEDGMVTPDELRTGLLDGLNTYDADGNGTLSLDEFETMHMAHIRERTVDRFQDFDADGDGQVTPDEISRPADRMQRMMDRRASMTPPQMQMIDSDEGESGTTDSN